MATPSQPLRHNFSPHVPGFFLQRKFAIPKKCFQTYTQKNVYVNMNLKTTIKWSSLKNHLIFWVLVDKISRLSQFQDFALAIFTAVSGMRSPRASSRLTLKLWQVLQDGLLFPGGREKLARCKSPGELRPVEKPRLLDSIDPNIIKNSWIRWFQIFFIFTPNLGEDFQFDEHIFQLGWNLKPPTRKAFFHIPANFWGINLFSEFGV